MCTPSSVKLENEITITNYIHQWCLNAPYAYGTIIHTIRVWLYHTRIRVWYVPYAYGTNTRMVQNIAMNDYACILIWDAHTRMGHNIVPYAYGISHTRMGRPIRVWANIRIWGRTETIFGHLRDGDVPSSISMQPVYSGTTRYR